jgi:hypothetical protein
VDLVANLSPSLRWLPKLQTYAPGSGLPAPAAAQAAAQELREEVARCQVTRPVEVNGSSRRAVAAQTGNTMGRQRADATIGFAASISSGPVAAMGRRTKPLAR